MFILCFSQCRESQATAGQLLPEIRIFFFFLFFHFLLRQSNRQIISSYKIFRDGGRAPQAIPFVFAPSPIFSRSSFAFTTAMAEGGREEVANSLEYTPTWVVAVVCSIIVLISLAAERGLHRLGKLVKEQHALFDALLKLKEELMVLGFISLLLTAFQGLIGRICIPEHLAHTMLPCKRESAGTGSSEHYLQSTRSRRRLLEESSGANSCSQGMAPFMSVEALHQLHIFIFVLAVVYVIFSATTMVLGEMKVKRWKHWEKSIKHEVSGGPGRAERIHAAHHNAFKQRAVYSSAVNLIRSFFKQFYDSVSKSDYFALRLGFIKMHCPSNPSFDFHNYMMRTLQHDFKKVVGISWFLWAFVVLFLLVNLAGWHSYFYMSFLPLILLLLVGAKLEYIITSLAKEIGKKNRINEQDGTKADGQNVGEPFVKPSDKHFWFGRPSIVLYLIHFILFQNSFEIAFFFWILITYGSHSCILEKIGFIIPRLIVGFIVQVLCSYSTLPLYTIVSQMGSMFKESMFNEHIQSALANWAAHTRRSSHHSQLHGAVPESVELAPLPAGQQTAILVDEPTSRRDYSCSSEENTLPSL